MGDKESYHGIYDSTWIRAIGWIPPAGSSISFVADAYFELSYFYLVFLYLVGRMFALFWLRARFIGKGWSVLYVVVASISIFLAAQDVPAFFFRLLFVSALTLAIAWFLRVPFSLRVQRDEQDSYVSHR